MPLDQWLGLDQKYSQGVREMVCRVGLEGSYEVLGASSTAQDERKLKALRERILQRNSDEAFYDHQKVNEIIVWNRLAQSLENKKTSNKPDAGGGQ